MISSKRFKPPGVYLKDIQEYTGFSNVKKACEMAGVELYQLDSRTISPLSLAQAYNVLRVIRSLQGEKHLKNIARPSGRCKEKEV